MDAWQHGRKENPRQPKPKFSLGDRVCDLDGGRPGTVGFIVGYTEGWQPHTSAPGGVGVFAHSGHPIEGSKGYWVYKVQEDNGPRHHRNEPNLRKLKKSEDHRVALSLAWEKTGKNLRAFGKQGEYVLYKEDDGWVVRFSKHYGTPPYSRLHTGYLSLAKAKSLAEAQEGGADMSAKRNPARVAGALYDYETADYLRQATAAETRESVNTAKHDGGAGAIRVDGRTCYVIPETRTRKRNPAADKPWALAKRSGWDDLVVGMYETREDAEAALKKKARYRPEHGDTPQSVGYTIVKTGKGTPGKAYYSVISFDGKKQLRINT